MRNKIRILAHRGGPTRAPANTICAFKRAIDDGADGFECDVALTRDEEPVVIHKSFYTNRITKIVHQKGKLDELTWAELKLLRTNGEQIPHLDDVLDFVVQHPVECFIEPKLVSDRLIERIISGISQNGLEKQVRIITFFHRRQMLWAVKKLNSRVTTSVILLNPLGSWIKKADAAAADIVVPGWRFFNQLKALHVLGLDLKTKVAETHAAGIPVYSGVADDEKTISWLSTLGVRGVFTDNVCLAKTVISDVDPIQIPMALRGTRI